MTGATTTFKRLESPLQEGIAQTLWFLFFASAFSCFVRIPISLLVDVLSVAFLIVLLSAYAYEWIQALYRRKIKAITLIMLPLILMPIISALEASRVFGQPVLYGFLAQRQVFYSLAAHFVYIALEKQWISTEQFSRYLMRSLIILLLIFLLFYVFIDPKQWLNTEFVTLSPNKGYRYEFPDSCIYGLLLYSLFQVWISRNRIWLIVTALTLVYILLYLLDRTQLLAIIGTIGVFVLLNFKVARAIRLFVILFFVLLTTGITLWLVAPDALEKNMRLYVSAYETISGKKVTEASANVRFMESQIAWAGFREHPVFGVGFLSARWKDGFRSISRYFYPTDVGLLGNLYVYGIIGTCIFYIPFFLAWKYRKHLRNEKDPLLLAAQYLMLFLFVDMLTAATNQKYYGVVSVFFGIVYYYRYRNTSHDKHSQAIG